MKRRLTAEQMDEPSLPIGEHELALKGLQRINRASGVAQQYTKRIMKFAGGRPITMLDVASGGGDVSIAIVEAARSSGITIDLSLFDKSDVGLTRSQSLASSKHISVNLLTGDAIQGLPGGRFDIVTCSLFLHHLDEAQAIRVLGHLRGATRGLLLVSDLCRSFAGWIAAHIACRALSRSAVVHFDGPVSAQAAWTVAELKSMAARAGMPNVSVQKRWPFRMLLEWENHD